MGRIVMGEPRVHHLGKGFGVVAVAGLLAMVTACGDDSGTSAQPAETTAATGSATTAPATTTTLVEALEVTRSIPLGDSPYALVPDASGQFWTALSEGPTLVRIDPGAGTATTFPLGAQQLEPPGPPMVFAAGSLWVVAPPEIVRVDPATGAVMARIAAAADVYYVAAAPDGVWFSSPGAGTVAHIDGATNQVGSPIAVPAEPKELLLVDGALWVASHIDGGLRRIDIAAGAVDATVTGLEQPRQMAFDGDRLWVADLYEAVAAVNPRAATLEERIDQPGVEVFTIQAASGRVYAAGIGPRAGTLITIDAASSDVSSVRTVGTGHLGQSYWDGSRLWVVDIEGGSLVEADEA